MRRQIKRIRVDAFGRQKEFKIYFYILDQNSLYKNIRRALRKAREYNKQYEWMKRHKIVYVRIKKVSFKLNIKLNYLKEVCNGNDKQNNH